MTRKGFSLIELLLYVSISGAVLSVISALALNVIYGKAKLQAVEEVNQNGRYLMDRIARGVRIADSINSPQEGGSGSTLSLKMADPSKDPTVFDLDSGVVRMREGSGPITALTADEVAATALEFINVSYPDTPGAVRIGFTLQHRNPSGRREFEADLELVSTASLRGGALAPGPSLCQGTPTACTVFKNRPQCQNQEGCVWNPGACFGTCTPCELLGFHRCLLQFGCSWAFPLGPCEGTCTDCSILERKGWCSRQRECSWMGRHCSATPAPCEEFTTEAACVSQDGCAWVSQ